MPLGIPVRGRGLQLLCLPRLLGALGHQLPHALQLHFTQGTKVQLQKRPLEINQRDTCPCSGD